MRIASLVCIAVLAGCGAHTNVRVGSGAGVPPGTTVLRSSVGVHVESGSAAAALVAAGILAAAWHADERERDRSGNRAGLFAGAGAAPLAEWRRVNAQDCTRPIADASANLSCK